MLVDPNTAASLRVGDIFDLADAMVDAHRELLPEAFAAANGTTWRRCALSARVARVRRRLAGMRARR